VAAVAALFVLAGLAYVKESGELAQLVEIENLGKKKDAEIEEQKKRYAAVMDISKPREALEAISTIASERDMILKIMDEINPNIPDNGKWDLPLDSKLWVVDWKFEEKEKPKEVPAGTDPGAAARAAMAAGAGKPLPTSKILVTTLEVVITKKDQEGKGRDFILKTLLNYNPAAKARFPGTDSKGCVIKNKHWDLEGGQWRVELDHNTNDAIEKPVPKTFIAKQDATPGDVEVKRFWRYRVTLEVPIGEENRKLAVAGDTKPAGK